jgi:hypothetical protein
VVPDLLHVVPVGHDAVLDGILEGEDAALGLGLGADVGILLAHANHHAHVARAAHNGGEDGSGSVVTTEASLAHARAVVDHESLDVIIIFVVVIGGGSS